MISFFDTLKKKKLFRLLNKYREIFFVIVVVVIAARAGTPRQVECPKFPGKLDSCPAPSSAMIFDPRSAFRR